MMHNERFFANKKISNKSSKSAIENALAFGYKCTLTDAETHQYDESVESHEWKGSYFTLNTKKRTYYFTAKELMDAVVAHNTATIGGIVLQFYATVVVPVGIKSGDWEDQAFEDKKLRKNVIVYYPNELSDDMRSKIHMSLYEVDHGE